MNELFVKYSARLNALETKERVLLTVAGALVITMIWFSLGIDPLDAERRRLTSQTTARQTQIAELNETAVQIVEAAQNDPNKAVERQIEEVDREIAQLEQTLEQRVGELTEPALVPQILKDVLTKTETLEFVSLDGLGAERLVNEQDGEALSGTVAQAYRHGFRLTVKGSYLDSIRYLKALEASPWRFFWEGVEIEVTQHPSSQISIVVYTLSLERSWIGV